ncbi:MAG: SCP2 sterol-binding domain-containing protein [Chitinophagales bacterium]|nr:SCP2 sterol-binding domain-containing protein [Chitinophagales bacterium]
MTAKELILSLPSRFKPEAGKGIIIVFHFIISGDNGGSFTVKVDDGICTTLEGLEGEPKCMIETSATDYEDVEYGRTNAQMAVLFGKIKVSNIGSMLKFVEMF